MKDERVKRLNSSIVKLLSEFERVHNITISGVTIVVNDSVCKGIVSRSFAIETSYNEEEK